jgi:hypothetical protein
MVASKVRTFAQAGACIERVGFCVLFPIKDLPLPSLWAAVKGRSPKNFNLVAAWDSDAEKLWGWKDEFPKRRRAWYGKYFRGKASLISPAFLPCFYCLEENYGTPDEHERLYAEGKITADAHAICGGLLEHGPQGILELRHALGWTSKRGNQRFKRALEEVQRRLLVVRWGTKPETNAWESAVYQLTPRAFPRAVRAATKVTRSEAQRAIAAQYLRLNPRAGERDLVRVFKWSRMESRAALSAVS